jgi:N-acetyl-gamma-glutamyl-phosphate reductase common form
MEIGGKKLKAAIFGGSGYGGSELLRILLFHPNAEIVFVTANEHAGKAVSEVHKNLLGLTGLIFEKAPDDLSKINADVSFFALPHGQALELIPQLPANIKAIDLSGDFRIDDKDIFKEFYKLEHTADTLQQNFIYGLTETNREKIKDAQYIANPGCFATATLLALAPLVKTGVIFGKVIVDAKTGSSGSGAKPAANTHHPQRMNSFYAYKPFTHQHVPEIEQHLNALSALSASAPESADALNRSWQDRLVFITHSLPVSRGIFASCYVELKEEIPDEELKDLYKNFYQNAFFVRIVDGSPDINWVKNTNFCDVAIHVKGRQAVIFSALDNLVKGAAGQAVQNMNLMFGLDEKTGLVFTGANP